MTSAPMPSVRLGGRVAGTSLDASWETAGFIISRLVDERLAMPARGMRIPFRRQNKAGAQRSARPVPPQNASRERNNGIQGLVSDNHPSGRSLSRVLEIETRTWRYRRNIRSREGRDR